MLPRATAVGLSCERGQLKGAFLWDCAGAPGGGAPRGLEWDSRRPAQRCAAPHARFARRELGIDVRGAHSKEENQREREIQRERERAAESVK